MWKGGRGPEPRAGVELPRHDQLLQCPPPALGQQPSLVLVAAMVAGRCQGQVRVFGIEPAQMGKGKEGGSEQSTPMQVPKRQLQAIPLPRVLLPVLAALQRLP